MPEREEKVRVGRREGAVEARLHGREQVLAVGRLELRFATFLPSIRAYSFPERSIKRATWICCRSTEAVHLLVISIFKQGLATCAFAAEHTS